MLLTPTEMERLTIFTAAELSRKRKAKGLKLNHPEAIAFITDEILEGAREGRSVADLISFGSTLLSTDDVLPGVSDLISMIQVEVPFQMAPNWLRSMTQSGRAQKVGGVSPGELDCEEGDIEINAGRRSVTIKVVNTGDRPVQIGSHYHFFETNKALEFDRASAFGLRLDIPAGTAVRFEPGEAKEVVLTEFGGTQELYGLNNLTNGQISSQDIKDQALERARTRGFKGA